MRFEASGAIIIAAAFLMGCATVPTEAQLRSAAEHSEATLANSAAIAEFSRSGLRNADDLRRSFRLGFQGEATLLVDQIPASLQTAFSAKQVFNSVAVLGGVRAIWLDRRFENSPDGRLVVIEDLKVDFSPPGCPTPSTLQSALSAQPHFSGVTDVSDNVSFEVHGGKNSVARIWSPLSSCTVVVSRTAALA